MQAQADELNKTLGDGAVTIDETTGAIKLYGKELEDGSDELDNLIKLKEADNIVTELQGKVNEATAKKAAAESRLQQEADSLTRGEKRALNDVIKESTAVIEENSAMLDGAIAVQEEARQKTEELAFARGEALKAEGDDIAQSEAYNLARQQLEDNRELSTDEHYAKLKELATSNYTELGLTEEEYITQMAEHQQAIDDATKAHQEAIEQATQEHVDTLFGINEEGLYNESKTVEEMNAIHEKNQKDMANYYSNLNGLADEGWDNLVWYFEQGGVKTGGTLQNTMDDLQGIGLDGWREIQADWEANGNKLSDAMKEKYGDINVDAGFGVLEWSETIGTGLEDGARYGEDAVGSMVGGMETTMANVNTAAETGGQTVTETSAQAGEDAAQSFVGAVEDNMGDVETIGKLTGTSWMTGVIAGIKAMQKDLRSKVTSIANSLKISASISASSSRVKVNTYVPHYATGGLVYGPQLAVVGDNPNARNDPELIAPMSKLKAIITNQLESIVQSSMPSLRSNNATYNYYNDNKTDNRQEAPLVAIDKYYQNSEQDQKNLAYKMEMARRERALAIGANI